MDFPPSAHRGARDAEDHSALLDLRRDGELPCGWTATRRGLRAPGHTSGLITEARLEGEQWWEPAVPAHGREIAEELAQILQADWERRVA